MALSKEDILGFANAKPVKVKAFGGTVYVKPMSGKDRDEFEIQVNGSDVNIRTNMLVRTLCDANGQKLFSNADTATLGDKDVVELDKCFTVSRKISGFNNADIDELAKN